jgi:hypothetical protein
MVDLPPEKTTSEVNAGTMPAIGISVSHQIGEDRNVVFQCFVPFDCPPVELDAALDKVFRASSRQKAAIRLPQAKLDLTRLRKGQKRAAERIVEVRHTYEMTDQTAREMHTASGRRTDYKPTAQIVADRQKQKIDLDNLEIAMKRGREDIEHLEEEIAELEKIVAGG